MGGAPAGSSEAQAAAQGAGIYPRVFCLAVERVGAVIEYRFHPFIEKEARTVDKLIQHACGQQVWPPFPSGAPAQANVSTKCLISSRVEKAPALFTRVSWAFGGENSPPQARSAQNPSQQASRGNEGDRNHNRESDEYFSREAMNPAMRGGLRRMGLRRVRV